MSVLVVQVDEAQSNTARQQYAKKMGVLEILMPIGEIKKIKRKISLLQRMKRFVVQAVGVVAAYAVGTFTPIYTYELVTRK